MNPRESKLTNFHIWNALNEISTFNFYYYKMLSEFTSSCVSVRVRCLCAYCYVGVCVQYAGAITQTALPRGVRSLAMDSVQCHQNISPSRVRRAAARDTCREVRYFVWRRVLLVCVLCTFWWKYYELRQFINGNGTVFYVKFVWN